MECSGIGQWQVLINALDTKKEITKMMMRRRKDRKGLSKCGFIHPSMPGHLPSSDMNRTLMEAVTNDFTGGQKLTLLDCYLQLPQYPRYLR